MNMVIRPTNMQIQRTHKCRDAMVFLGHPILGNTNITKKMVTFFSNLPINYFFTTPNQGSTIKEKIRQLQYQQEGKISLCW